MAVLYFDNHTGDAKWAPLQKGLADMMVTDLTGTPGLVVVERARLEALLAELKLQRSRFFDPKTAQRIGKGVGARFAVTGAMTAVSPQVRIDVRLLDVATARVVMADSVVGKAEDFFSLQQRLVGRFRGALAQMTGGPPSAAATERIADDAPISLDDALTYGKAITAADDGDLKTAQRALTALVARAPGFALAKARYLEIMRRLAQSKRKRATGLVGAEAGLAAKIEERCWLSIQPPSTPSLLALLPARRNLSRPSAATWATG